jgi:hypothetical protein
LRLLIPFDRARESIDNPSGICNRNSSQDFGYRSFVGGFPLVPEDHRCSITNVSE